MMRSLYTAASGMKTQQMNVDTISNNLANVNTTGFKKERLEFKSLLYETLAKAGTDQQGNGKPVNLQVGHGVKPVGTVRSYTIGTIQKTDNPLDLAITGDGFFTVKDQSGSQVYTKDGSFKIALVDDRQMLITSDGYQVLDINDEPIYFDSNIDIKKISISSEGNFSYVTNDNEVVPMDSKMKMVQFRNVNGLEALGNNLLRATSSSGEAILEEDDEDVVKSQIVQGSLEGSNVQVVEEMVNLIVAQRAYEVSSKAIQASDEMLSQANNLKR
ncbi:flagellar basal-body rod protein FlgG [Vallitalea longa]|uniref:Flagellar basal-body rod protein FlgG n=1 Tax=Vallitalea longa TaxID=2936439 RepID=A0A9W6DDA8_9FIRM|nr:flagellar basal-body rod protein FlgG [Vallitalea longa]GKX28501.1 flagellar basal-body rod protein FlgG [Vallitalea longa]